MDNMIKNAHMISSDEVVMSVETDINEGLSEEEAKKRLEKYGENVIGMGKKVSALKILFNNTNNIIVYMLMLAAAVAFFMGDQVEGFAVIIAILVAILSGFVSEYKAQRSVDSLKKLTVTTAKVIRNSKTRQIESKDLVIGDILFLEEGDSITADARIVKNKNFASIESALTGESEAVGKDHEYIGEADTPMGDRKNMVYAGTAATRGNAYAVITGTGMNSEIGKISKLLEGGEDTATPLEKQLNKLGRMMIIFAALVALIVTVIGLLAGEDMYVMIKIGIILAIAAIPEALPAVSTITLAIGMKTMASRNALVKNLPAVETLGSTTVICTDKTGTLTENQMTVGTVHLANDSIYDVEGAGYEPNGRFLKDNGPMDPTSDKSLMQLLISGALSSNASLVEEDQGYSVIGDPTEGGIIVLGMKAGVDRQKLESDGYERIGEIPFSSKEKFMATAYELSGGTKTIFIKGAPDVLMEMDKKGDNEKYFGINDKLATSGMRVLCVAQAEGYKGDGSESSMREHLEKGIEILGFTGISDPPREDVKEAIKQSQQAGIRVIMITGDHPGTARNIAAKIGLENPGGVITGKEMDRMTDEELAEEIKRTSVFARVSPENKLQIVRALNIDDEVTAMTGDGVNDAPALKGADIGIAMGIRGTEVAKEAADMILTDDRFATIVDAVEQGRIIFDNIRKFVYFLFSCNVVEILAVFLTIIFRLPMPVTALQILWLNLVVDVLPAMSLAWEGGEKDIMKRKPRDPKEAIMNKGFLLKILGNGSLIGIGALAVFYLSLSQGFSEDAARTVSFSTMAIGQLFHIFNVREVKSFGLDKSILKNKFMIISLISSVLLQLLAVYLPFFNRVMDTVPLGSYEWLLVLAGAAAPTIIIQLLRILKKSRVDVFA